MNASLPLNVGQQHSFRQRLWRWHFFAGLIICPFAILLAFTGAIYLFKPQIEHYQERQINALESYVGATTASQKQTLSKSLNALLIKYPNAQFKRLRLNKLGDVTVEYELRHGDGQLITHWVSVNTGEVLASQPKDKQFLQIVKKLHSELLLGNKGSYVVEVAASWLIILIISGVYLWLSKPSHRTVTNQSKYLRVKKLLIPQLRTKKVGVKWRSLHGVVGLWLAFPILILLFTGLPWTQLWGSGFDAAKTLLGWNGPGQEWKVTLQSGLPSNKSSDSQAVAVGQFDGALWSISDDEKTTASTLPSSRYTSAQLVSLDIIANKPEVLALTHPVIVMPPKTHKGVWTVRAMPSKRSERVTLHYDQYTGEDIMRIDFQDHHPVQRFISQGISLHEGALFGGLNQALGVLTAFAVMGISLVGLYMWWLRRPAGSLAAPTKASYPPPKGLLILVFFLGVFLPAAGISFVFIVVLEYLWALLRRASTDKPVEA